jgi:hypothetical protein
VFVSGADGHPAFLVHSVAAGPDATMRPGNVFSQVLIDRGLTAALVAGEQVRPIQYWRSPGWLAPYGPDAVRSAHIDETVPLAPGQVVNRDCIAAFVTDERTPVSRITELLNATAVALNGDTGVVLIVDDLDDAARWIGTVSFLASPPTAARLTFSTYERTGDLLANGAPAMLSVVLRADFFDTLAGHPTAAAHQDRLTFFDLAADAEVVSYGPQASPCDWSALVVELFDETEDTIRERLLLMDAISREHPEAKCPWWPLAVAMAQTESSAEGQQVAAAAILRETPADVDLDPDLSLTVRQLLGKIVDRDRAALLTVLGDHDQPVSPHLPLLSVALEAVPGHVAETGAGDASASRVREAVIAEIHKRGDVQPSWAASSLVLLDQLTRASGLHDLNRWHSRVADALAREVHRDPRLPGSLEIHEKTQQRLDAVRLESAQQCR